MRLLFALLIASFAISDVFGLEMSLAPGLSVKNAILYLIAAVLFLRMALSGWPQRRIPLSNIVYLGITVFAVVSWVIAWKVMHYRGYHGLQALIILKSRMMDSVILLFALFYGLRDERDCLFLLRFMLGAVALANVATLLDTAGILHVGMRIGDSGPEAGRVFGAFGHANETGALIVCLLPALVAFSFSERGFTRLMWAGGTFASLMVLLLTVSRGAFVGLAVGCVIAGFICRQHVPLHRFVLWGVGAVALGLGAVVIAGLVDPHLGGTIVDRLMGQSRSMDMSEMSSGRTAIWAEALGQMVRHPITFLTGFGWEVYMAMPFRYAPHNFYLGMWFDLGIFAVIAFIVVLWSSISNSIRMVSIARPELRLQFIAYVFGMMSLAVSIMFADLWKPWPYIWVYMAITLRLVGIVRENASQPRPRVEAAQAVRPLIGAPLPAFHQIGGIVRPREQARS